ncbi:hypothetical protein JM946_25310 [Steroidobacter sp. S1-65]|uniref:Uncharacterized protein n=1 Tax=Steroidobacter gossypii TaxID=2805490 RepID=A0ABS1X4B7_9GAMM|nr:hypothetical protein [Steroidobacter gossypii]MBM0108064.1 hypothetical protein [Steroidobacter gossypii]
MDYRNPVVVIDQTIDNLMYLVELWLEDLDVAVALNCDLLTRDDAKSLAALRAARALLPRLRIVRSNYESSPSLPDAAGYVRDRAMEEYVAREQMKYRKLLRPWKDPWKDSYRGNGQSHSGPPESDPDGERPDHDSDQETN